MRIIRQPVLRIMNPFSAKGWDGGGGGGMIPSRFLGVTSP